jgi:hypothetical protein
VELIDQHTALSEHIMETMLYFDVFSYPLNAEEVHRYLHVNGTSQNAVNVALAGLVERKHVFQFGEFYSLHADEKNIERRIRGNREAEKWIVVARQRARLIAHFPFVRAVMASGSLSKGYMDENSDLDFFLITVPNRLWIARTLLVLYKRIFLSGSHKQFCVNYFVDSRHLEIEEQNIFTATELATLVPLYDEAAHGALLESNKWLHEFLPNFKARSIKETVPAHAPLLRRFLEFVLTPVASLLDRFFMHLSLRRWKRLYESQFDKKEFQLAFKTRRHVSKNHPNNYQKKILDRYHKKVEEHTRHCPGHRYE